MGCTSCKISQLDTQFFRTCKNNNSLVVNIEPLLTMYDRNFWTQQLSMKGVPQEDFWQQFNGCHHSCFSQIQKDINRTFPTLPFFSHKGHVSRFQLLLRKFAIYFPKIGYTQGLNFLAGYLLMGGFDDQSSFKILVQLMVHQKILAIGLYQDQFPLNRFYCQVFWNLLNCKLPKVAQKIRKSNIQDEIWIFQWFISFFLYSFPHEFVKKFWDFVILKKQLSMVLVALGIVRCLKNQILGLKSDDQFEFIQLFQQTKDLNYCNKNIDLKKLTIFISSITQHQIQKAINETKCLNNHYRKYFSASSSQKNQIHMKMINYFKLQRNCYKLNPDPKKYTRKRDSINHLQNLMLSKYRYYQSQYGKSNVSSNLFKMSTFSISINSLNEFQRRSHPIFNNSILGKLKFTQSKVIQNGVQFINMKKSHHLSPNQINRKGINPFQQILQKHQTSKITLKTNNQSNNFKKQKNNQDKQYPDFSKKSNPYYFN